MTAAEKWRLSLLSKFVNFRRRFSAGSPWSREPSESGPICGRRFRRFPPATDQPRKDGNEKKKSNFTHHLVNVAVSWHALPFNAHRVGLPSCCLQLFQLGQSGVPRTGCRSAVPLSKSLPKGGNEKKKRRNGYNKNCSSPRLLLGRRLARPSSSSFLFARLRTCVCVWVCVCMRKGCALKIFFLAFPLRGRLGRPEVPFRIAVAPDFFPDRARSYSSVIHVD